MKLKTSIEDLQTRMQPLKREMEWLASGVVVASLTPSHNESFRRYCSELAGYFSGQTKTNKHFRDYQTATFYGKKALDPFLTKNKIPLPNIASLVPAGIDGFVSTVYGSNPNLTPETRQKITELQAKMKPLRDKGFTASEIMSNPRISREFNKTWEMMYGDIDRQLQKALADIKK